MLNTAVEPAKGYLEKETDIRQGNGKGLGCIFAWLSEKNGGCEKPEAVPVTKAEDNESKQGL